MKRMWPIKVLVFVVIVGGALAIRYGSSVVPYWQCSEVYKRYHKVEGVQATYIKNYPVNDTLTIGVTLLEATDSAGWEYLKQAFNISQEMQTMFKQACMDIIDWQSPRDHPEIRAITKGENRDTTLTDKDIEACALSFKECKICVFHTRNENEIIAIDNYNCDKMIKQTNIIDHE